MATAENKSNRNSSKKRSGRTRPETNREAINQMVEKTLQIDEAEAIRAWRPLYQVIKTLFKPKVYNHDQLPDAPVMFVSNHSTLAMDGFVLGPLIHQELDRFPRAMGDDFLFAQPKLADFLIRLGGVLGHQDVCDALMENGKDIMVFPGGAHEANKPVRNRYTLQWKERTGFIRLAAKHGYTIVPLALVGPDEWYDRYVEPEDFYDTALGKLLIRLGMPEEMTHPDITPPLIKGMLGTPFPKPVRCYMGVGQPLDLSEYQGEELTNKRQQKLRQKVADELEGMIAELLLIQAQEKNNQGLLRRILSL